MILNYYKTGLRNILKYNVFSIINIFGLATGMAVCMLVMVMFSDQKTYDDFHSKKEITYRILTSKPNAKVKYSAVTSAPLARVLKDDYAIVRQSTRLNLGVGGDATYKNTTTELRGYFTDPSFFEVFDYPLETGDKKTALSSPNSIVITHSAAVELFGAENPMGKVITFSDRGLNILKGVDIERPASYWGEYAITGIINDDGLKSHLRFDALFSESSAPVLIQQNKLEDFRNNWLEHNTGYTYVCLTPGKTEADLLNALQDVIKRNYSNEPEAKGLALVPQKLPEITPGIFVSSPSNFSLPLPAYYFLSALALIIMISACLNYTNLATARALSRMKEIGVRKVTGASRKALVTQFLSESILTALISLTVAVGLLLTIRPAFNSLWINRYLGFDLELSPSIFLNFAALAVIIGTLAGLYPAFYLSRFRPINVLKNQVQAKTGRLTMQKALSTVQFVVSLFFIVTAMLLYRQFKHHLTLEYGFVSKNIINVSLQSANYDAASLALGRIPGVVEVSACDEIPGSGQGTHGMTLKKRGSDEEKSAVQLRVDDNFIDNLELKLIAGKNLPESYSDTHIVVNESAVKDLGYEFPSAIIGEVFESNIDKQPLEVIGVVKDFRFRMAAEKDKIEPLVLRHQGGQYRFLQLKIATQDIQGLVAALQNEWKKVDPNHVFKYQFFDEQLRATNKALFDVVTIINVIALLAVVIACLGLLGMITYQAARKKKEVGIRKVLGADVINIAVMLSRNFLIMLGLSVCVGAPLSYFVNNLWLENFPNRVDFGFELILASAMLLSLGFLTISAELIKASRTNPAEVLRAE